MSVFLFRTRGATPIRLQKNVVQAAILYCKKYCMHINKRKPINNLNSSSSSFLNWSFLANQ